MAIQFLNPTDCMGDSLYVINNNNLELSATIANNYTNLVTLINTLSTNMNTLQNIPYVRYAKSNPVAVTNPISLGSGSQIYKVILDKEETLINNLPVSINTVTGVITIPAGTYEVRLRMANFQVLNFGSGFNLDLALRRTGTSTYVFTSIPVHANVSAPQFNPITAEGRIKLQNTADLELCVRSYSTSNLSLNVGGGTTSGSSNQFTVEFYKVG